MSNLFVLIKNNLRILVLKKLKGTLITIFLPVIILILVSKMFSTTDPGLKIAVIDNSKTVSSNYIRESLKSIDGFTLVEMTEEKSKDGFMNKEIYASIIIKEDFESKVLKGSSDGLVIQGIEGENIADSIKSCLTPSLNNLINIGKVTNTKDDYYKFLNNLKDSEVNIVDSGVQDFSDDYQNTQTFLGFFIMFILFRALNGAELITEDKQERIYSRFMVAPVKEWQYYLANVISTLLAIEIQIVVSLIIIQNITPLNMGLTLLELFVVLSVVAVLSVSIGVFCLTIVNSRDLSSMISNFVVMTCLFLGGCFVPLKHFPSIAEKVSYLTPIRWAMQGIMELQQGGNLLEISKYLLIILGFSLVFFLIAVYSVKYRDKLNEA